MKSASNPSLRHNLLNRVDPSNRSSSTLSDSKPRPSKNQSTPTHSVRDYLAFDQLDGQHSFKNHVPGGFVDYQVRTRSGGKVVYFNFELAREMGLIPQGHPPVLTPLLEKKILQTFGLVIINEYDIENQIQFRPKDIRPHRYMATRYLQLQHPNKKGKTSGDGRGIWNGEVRAPDGKIWDVSSSGTGATCLSPAAAQTGKNFKTGDKRVGYGNGYNTLDEGLSSALMSEIFHKNGIQTERILAIIGFDGKDAGTSINVRAGLNLLRPSHFFGHLKQANHEACKGIVQYYLKRQVENRSFKPQSKLTLLQDWIQDLSKNFARAAARYEFDYIFCWMDWDGDNILANGGIIDYGSIRQFGMYYGDYRYDDVDRYSTRLPEQKFKAKSIIQNFVQLIDFIQTGKKKPLQTFCKDPCLQLFDLEFERHYDELMLGRLGWSAKDRTWLMAQHRPQVKLLRKLYQSIERARSKTRPYTVPDGINRDSVFCIRKLAQEFPKALLNQIQQSEPSTPIGNLRLLGTKDFLTLVRADSARPKDLKITPHRARLFRAFQLAWIDLWKKSQLISADPLTDATQATQATHKKSLLALTMRASVHCRLDRITGDAAILITDALLKGVKSLPQNQFQFVFTQIVEDQTSAHLPPSSPSPIPDSRSQAKSKSETLLLKTLRLIKKHREGL